MIDELLDLARAESPSFPVQRFPSISAAFLREVQAPTGIGRLPPPDEWRRAGRSRMSWPTRYVLRRVFDNLLMNARVHAGAGCHGHAARRAAGDTVRITGRGRWTRHPCAGRRACVRPVCDAVHARLRAATHGLGLAYCRAALAAMDGTITLRAGAPRRDVRDRAAGGGGRSLVRQLEQASEGLPAHVRVPRQPVRQRTGAGAGRGRGRRHRRRSRPTRTPRCSTVAR